MIVLQIANSILIITLGLYLGLFKSYFNEKGKNIATKEDIGEITEVVEKIRSDLTNETEILKSRLLLATQNKFSIKAAERDAIFELNKSFTAWISILMRFSFSGYDEDNIDELNQEIQNFKRKQLDLDLSESQLLLFMTDEKLLLLMRDLKIMLIDLEAVIVRSILNYTHEYRIHAIKTKLSQSQNAVQNYEVFNKKIMAIIDEFSEKRLEIFKTVTVKDSTLRQIMKSRLIIIEE